MSYTANIYNQYITLKNAVKNTHYEILPQYVNCLHFWFLTTEQLIWLLTSSYFAFRKFSSINIAFLNNFITFYTNFFIVWRTYFTILDKYCGNTKSNVARCSTQVQSHRIF